MRFGDIFERFLQEAPISVIFRALLGRALDPNELNRLFERTAASQYTRELLFSSDRRSDEPRRLRGQALGPRRLPGLFGREHRLANGRLREAQETGARRLSRPRSRHGVTAPATGPSARCHFAGKPVPGYRVKVLDGDHLAATEHRILPTRTTRAASLPGQALVALDPATMLAIDAAPCEDAHAQERSLIGQVLPGVEGGDLWIADRNFCTTRFLFGVRARRGCFLVRQHQSTLRWEAITPWNDVGRVVTGFVQHQMIRVTEVDGDGVMELRRIRLPLDRPTLGKGTELSLLTNQPQEDADALLLAETYRRRRTLENVFQSLTEALNREVNTLAYPKAASFGFCVALVAYDALAVIRAALRSEHGRDEVEAKASNYHPVREVATTYSGMMVAIPPARLWPSDSYLALP